MRCQLQVMSRPFQHMRSLVLAGYLRIPYRSRYVRTFSLEDLNHPRDFIAQKNDYPTTTCAI